MSDIAVNPPYPFDPTGTLASNKVTGEQQVLTGANSPDFYFLVPQFAPFFAESLVINYTSPQGESRPLDEGVDYVCTHWFIAASRACGKPIYGSISFLDLDLQGIVTYSYQTLGGVWTIDEYQIAEMLAETIHNPRVTAWEMVNALPATFPVIDHEWDLVDMVGMSAVVEALGRIEAAILVKQGDAFTQHLLADNPHHITPNGIGTLTTGQIYELINAIDNASALNDHLNAADPHPQYINAVELAAALAGLNMSQYETLLHAAQTYAPLTGAGASGIWGIGITGNAGTASKLASARSITTTGDATGTVNFDGSANVSFALTLANSGVAPAAYGSGTVVPIPTVDAKGRITAMATAAITPAGIGAIAATAIGAANGVAGLDATGKVPTSQLPASILGAMIYQGTWNAATNTPALASGVGTKGHYYKVGTAGNSTIDGQSGWKVGDIIAFNGTTWDWIDGGATEVTSVAGRVGAIVLSAADIGGLADSATTDTTDATNITSGTLSGARLPAFTGDVTKAAGGTILTLANTGVAAGTYNGSVTAITPFTVDAKGRITGVGAAVTITPAWASVVGRPTNVSQFTNDAGYTTAGGHSHSTLVNGTKTLSLSAAGVTQTPGDLNVAGAIVATGEVTAFSDERLKSCWQVIGDALDRIDQLEGGTFTRIDTGERSTGLKAQAVRAVLPEAVRENENGYLSVAYGNLVGLLIEGTKALRQQVSTLTSRLNTLEGAGRTS